MDIEIIILSEVRKRKTYHMMSLICGILKEDTRELMYKRNRLIDIRQTRGNHKVGRDKLGVGD